MQTTLYADPDDWYLQDPQAVFLDACNGPNPTYSDNNTETTQWFGFDTYTGVPNHHQAFWRYDASEIPPGSIINSATPKLTIVQYANQFDSSSLYEFYAFNWGTLGLGDTGNWRNLAWLAAEYAAGRRCFNRDGSTMGETDVNAKETFTLTAESYLLTALAAAAGGTLYLMGTVDNNRIGTQPPGRTRAKFYTGDTAVDSDKPQILVDYTPPAICTSFIEFGWI